MAITRMNAFSSSSVDYSQHGHAVAARTRRGTDTKGHPIELQINNVDLSKLREVMASIHNLLACFDLQLHHGSGITRRAY
jgi:hypothetical protein